MSPALLIAVLIAQAPSASAPAVEAPVDTAPLLTLEQALSYAKEHNLELQAARAKLAQAHELSRKVWAAYLPQLSVGGSYTRNNVEAKIGLPTGYYVRNVGVDYGPPAGSEVVGAPTPYVLYPSGFAELTIQKQNQLGGQAQLSQALIAPALWPAIQAAYLGEQVADLSVETARREILFGVAQLYYGAVGLKQVISVQRRQLELSQHHEKDARLRVETGSVPKAALLRAEIDRSRAEEDLKRAENSYRAAKIALSTLLDRDADFSVDTPRPVELPQNASALPDAAAKDRPDVQAARVSVDAANAGRTMAILKYLPNVGVSAVYRLANVQGFTGTYDSWAVMLGLNWTLFDGGLREAELRESVARIQEAEANAKSAERRARDEVTRALLDVDSAEANRLKAAEQLRLARENLDLVTLSYQSGAATYLEVEDAKTARLGAELGAVGEELNAALAKLRVIKAAGAWNP